MYVGFATLRMLHDRYAGRLDREQTDDREQTGDEDARPPLAPAPLPFPARPHRTGRGRYRRRSHHRDAA